MRPKVGIPFLILAVGLMAGIYFLRPASGRFKQAQSGPPSTESTATPLDPAPPAVGPTLAVDSTPTNDLGIAIRGTIAEHETYVEKRVAELQDLAMDDDPKSLEVILSELTNRDPEIRQAAVDAAVQFGSRDAIPKLTDAALQTDDAVERAQMLQAADYLKLPSYRETVGDLPAGKPVGKNLKLWRAPAAGGSTDPKR